MMTQKQTEKPIEEQSGGNPGEYAEHVEWEVYTPEQSAARLQAYLDVIWRRKKFLLSFVFGGTLLVAAYTFVMPHTYMAEAKLMPPEEPSRSGPSFSALLASGGIDLGGLGSNPSAKVFVAILQSRTLADSLIERLNLVPRMELPENRQLAINALQAGMWVEDDKSGVVRIQYSVETPRFPGAAAADSAAHLAAEIANESIELLDVLNREKMVTRASRSRDFLAEMKELKRAELDTARANLARFQKQNRAFALDQQIEAAVGSLAQVQAQIQLKELELAAAERELNPDGQVVEGLRTELAELRRQRAGVAGTDVLGMNLDATPDLVKDYAELRLDLEVAAQVYTYLESQYSSEQVQAARDLPTVSVLDFAEPSPVRASPRRTFIVMIAFAVLLIFGFGILFILELFGSEFSAFAAERLKKKK